MLFIKTVNNLATYQLKYINNRPTGKYSGTLLNLKMSQKTIASYFQKSSPIVTGAKRSSIDAENVDNSNILPDKKLKPDSESDVTSTVSPTKQEKDLGQVPEGKEAKEEYAIVDKSTPTKNSKKLLENENKLKAELKLLSKSLPALHPNIGLSWFEALRNEFGKPYFKKVPI